MHHLIVARLPDLVIAKKKKKKRKQKNLPNSELCRYGWSSDKIEEKWKERWYLFFIATCIYKRKHNQRWFANFNERTNTLLCNFMYLSQNILDVSVVCERWVETRTDCYIEPTSTLDHNTLCYLQEPTEHFFRILAGVAQTGVAEGHSPQSASWPPIWPSWPTISTAAGTCLYSFQRPLAPTSSSAYLHRCIS